MALRPGRARRGKDSGGGTGNLALLLTALASTLVAMGVILSGPFEHAASLTFAVHVPPGDSEALRRYRNELMDCAWTFLAHRGPGEPLAWQVAADVPAGTVRVDLKVGDPAQGEDTLHDLAEAYLDHLGDVADDALAARGQGERIVEQRLARLRAALSRTMRRERDTRAALPAENPLDRRETARQALAVRRRAFAAGRRELHIATRRLEELRATALPEHPPVDPLARESALWADVELRQDLGELCVRLTAVRTYLLDVWQEASPALDELIAAAGDVEQLGLTKAGDVSATPQRAALERAAEAACDYHRLLTDFARTWTKEFVGVQQARVDPAVARMLDVEERLSSTLGDFLFASSAQLTVIRDQVRAVGEQSDGQARHHVLIANLTRAFHALQTAHHRFEFAASMVRRSNNFRLAAAVKSAEGLRRRALRQERVIDLRLEQAAREAAAQAREEEIAALERGIAELRAAGQARVDGILDLQDRIDGVTPAADRFTGHTATAAVLGRRVTELAGEIARTEEQLAGLAAARQTPVDPQAVRVTASHVDPTPTNLPRRMAFGWAAGVTTFLALILVQRLLPRRRR